MVKTFDKSILSKAVNDNIHCTAIWKFVHKWSEHERDEEAPEFWNEQRIVHYLYEIINRPWLPDAVKVVQARAWLRHDKFFTANIYTTPTLREFVTLTSGRTYLIYENEERIEREAKLKGISPYQDYVDIFKTVS